MLRQWGFARPQGFGGTGLFSGIGALFGFLLIDMISNGLILAGLGVSQHQIICGLITIIQLRWRGRNDG